ncbi:YqgE/AlgH family protein [Zavarzinia sp. CC-PAN008]|uniref:YqgE/AlgH family protein n=1 Tax=Zavarzinia sp. CC-PAN008 TaxID=3243332 RepID=UPI003F74A764
MSVSPSSSPDPAPSSAGGSGALDGGPTSLEGQILIAMPTMGDPRFERTVILMCAHSPQGAMGLVVNKLIDHITFPELLGQLGIPAGEGAGQIRVHFGGPVETGRGFVLHSSDYSQAGTLGISGDIGLTPTIDILKAIAAGEGPRHSLLALGYAGWGPGQLDSEIQANAWLSAPADLDLLFECALERRWTRALAKLGIDLPRLSSEAGHA